MKSLLLFSWEQLLKLASLLKPVIELIRQIISIFKKDDDENNEGKGVTYA